MTLGPFSMPISNGDSFIKKKDMNINMNFKEIFLAFSPHIHMSLEEPKRNIIRNIWLIFLDMYTNGKRYLWVLSLPF